MQTIIDLFPDAVNEFGLIGCAVFSSICLLVSIALYRLAR